MQDLNSVLFYQIRFRLDSADPAADLPALLVSRIRAWLPDLAGDVRDPETAWSDFLRGGLLRNPNDLLRAESVRRDLPEAPFVCDWACAVTETPVAPPGLAVRRWYTEVGFRSLAPGSGEISLCVAYRDDGGSLLPRQPEPVPSAPPLLRLLMSDPALRCSRLDGTPLPLGPIHLTPDAEPRLRAMIADPARRLPLLFLSARPGSLFRPKARLCLSPESVWQALPGYAMVLWSDSAELTKQLCRGPDPLVEHPGEMALWFPSVQGAPPVCKRFSPETLWEQQGRPLLDLLRRALILDGSCGLFRLEHCQALLMSDLTDDRLRHLQNGTDEAMEVLLAESRHRQEAEWDRDALRRENYLLRARLEHRTAPAADDRDILDQLRALDKYPDTPEALARYFETLFPDRLAFTDRGRRSLEDCITKNDLLWEAFYHMAVDLWPLLQQEPATAYKRFREQTGWECSRGQGSMTRADARLMRQYRDEYQGRSINIEPHLKTGIRDADPRSVRIHFAYDPELQRILIGHCGRHLDNYTTRKIK